MVATLRFNLSKLDGNAAISFDAFDEVSAKFTATRLLYDFRHYRVQSISLSLGVFRWECEDEYKGQTHLEWGEPILIK